MKKVLILVVSIAAVSAFTYTHALDPALKDITFCEDLLANSGLKEGDLIGASSSDDPDIYIVNEHCFKRLFLNPEIFGFYGHLGGFGQVKDVTSEVRDAFVTSGIFRNCESGDERVQAVEIDSEDDGQFRKIRTSLKKYFA
jgi:hypothetical protein